MNKAEGRIMCPAHSNGDARVARALPERTHTRVCAHTHTHGSQTMPGKASESLKSRVGGPLTFHARFLHFQNAIPSASIAYDKGKSGGAGPVGSTTKKDNSSSHGRGTPGRPSSVRSQAWPSWDSQVEGTAFPSPARAVAST